MHFTSLLTTVAILSGLAVAVPASNKPTGGPASAQVTIYTGPWTCKAPNSPPPTDGSAGASRTFTIAETQCQIIDIPFSGAVTANLTATPKTGTIGCYVQLFTQQGCGVTLQNQYHGYPFDGVGKGNTMGCANPAGGNYGAVQLICE